MERKPSFSKLHYIEHIKKLYAACEWLGVDRGRAVNYSKLLKEFYEGDKRSDAHILAYGESCEIVDLFELWEHRVTDFPELDRKIKEVITKGPCLREQENPAESTNRARNNAFVYLVAGKLLAGGVPVIAVDSILARGATYESKADITYQWRGTLIDIECKRPQSDATLEKRTKEARDQIKDPSRDGRHGIIAIDCSVLVGPKLTLLESRSGEDADRLLSTQIEKWIAPPLIRYLTDFIPGLLFFARVPAKMRVSQSPIITAQGKPIRKLRSDSIATWLVCINENYAGPDALSALQLLEAEGKPNGNYAAV